MKKVITILAILVVLVGAVFAADETHTIKIKANVEEVLPAFQLLLLASAQTYTTNDAATPAVFNDSNAFAPLTNDTAKDVNFNLDVGGDVNVQVNLANLAKTTKAFTLSFSDGAFKGIKKQKQNAADHAPASITTSTGTTVADIYTITSGSAHVDPEDDTSALLTNQVITVQFLGKTVESTNVKLAGAVYHYNADTAIDPGWYYADIVLTVATN